MLIHAVLQGLLCAALLLTPALPAQEMPASAGEDQVIYVNPDGGRYYHASVQCDMLAPEFRPGMRRYEGEQAPAPAGYGSSGALPLLHFLSRGCFPLNAAQNALAFPAPP